MKHYTFEINEKICNHLIAKNNFRPPNDYADTFIIMNEQGLLDTSFTDTLIMMAHFRNRLVHIYWKININELCRIIQTQLNDIYKFIQSFKTLIKRNQ